MIQFLEDMQGKGTAPISSNEREQLERLRAEQAKLKEKLKVKQAHIKDKHADSDDDSDDSSEVDHFIYLSF